MVPPSKAIRNNNSGNRSSLVWKLCVVAVIIALVVYMEDTLFQGLLKNTTTSSANTNKDSSSTLNNTAADQTSNLRSVPVMPHEPPPEKSWMDEEYPVCIVGAGLSGAVIAERYASVLQQNALVLEKRPHLGGNCFDYIDEETNIRVSKYGAHLFHTYSRRVWDYVHRFAHWTPYEHKVLGLVKGKHVPIPVNIDTVNALFNLTIRTEDEMNAWLEQEQTKYDHPPANSEEMALSRVGPRLYELIFRPYTFKQWAKYPDELGPEVTARIPVRNNYDARYFSDPYQALPTQGYTQIFERLLDSKHITVKTSVDYFDIKDRLKCGRLYYTGPIDTYFADLGWPKLEYRSLDFERVVQRNVDYFQPASVVNHPQADDDYTRIVEYKHILNQSSPHTIYFIERSKDGGDPYYPVPNKKNQDLYKKYQEMANKEPNVTFVGRLANYRYFNMDQAILNALELFDKDSGIPEDQQWTDILAVEESETKQSVEKEGVVAAKMGVAPKRKKKRKPAGGKKENVAEEEKDAAVVEET